MGVVKKNISLEELAHKEKLGIRSLNICRYNGLNDLFTILNYFRENNDFLGLRNCGLKSNRELTELCEKYEESSSRPVKEKTKNPIEKQIDSLTLKQQKILNNLIESKANNLSVRSLNAIKKISDWSLTTQGLREILINPKYNLGKINNVGRKSINELWKFFYEIREQIEIIQPIENEDELTIKLFNTYLRRVFCLNSNDISQIWNHYNAKNGIPVFKTIDTLITSGYLFRAKEREVFKKSFNFWSDKLPKTLEDTSSIIGLTKERVRQLKKKLLNEIDFEFSFLKGIEFDALNLYKLDVDSEIIKIDENLIKEIQQKESVQFNNIFITKILSILLNKSHTLVGHLESCAFNSSKPPGIAYRWKSIYLVSKEIDNRFDFEALVIDLDKRLSNRIKEDYSFHLETYLVSFMKEGVEKDASKVAQVADYIISNEFGITIDLHGNISFKRNTIKQAFKYSYEALKALNEPSKVDVIYAKIKELYPDYTVNENSIRASMQKKNGFISFGRTSVYGLKIWEEEKNIRGGTIRNITEEYLVSKDEPQHIDNIATYVNKYRNTTAENIYSNLRMEASSRFSFFSGMYIGLKAKKYDNTKFKEIIEKNA
ncbi:MAG: hypothetical protein GDA42_00535 [Ekhidna sp.]|nr:hypothetical protein [Ekhidna sp.]